MSELAQLLIEHVAVRREQQRERHRRRHLRVERRLQPVDVGRRELAVRVRRVMRLQELQHGGALRRDRSPRP